MISFQILPVNGEIVFGSFATLAFTNEQDHSASCLGSGAGKTYNYVLSENHTTDIL